MKSFDWIAPVWVMSLSLVVGLAVQAEDAASKSSLQPRLGTKGKLLYEANFEEADSETGWNRTVGSLKAEAGVLKVSERSSDNHAAAFRRQLPVQDCAVQFDFKLTRETKLVHFGYDPATGELKKKGHLFSVAVSPTGWSLIEHGDKNDAKPKNIVHATAKEAFEPDAWHTILVECVGDKVVAQSTGKKPLEATSTDFRVKKPGLVFRVGGPDDKPVCFDNIKVWELK